MFTTELMVEIQDSWDRVLEAALMRPRRAPPGLSKSRNVVLVVKRGMSLQRGQIHRVLRYSVKRQMSIRSCSNMSTKVHERWDQY
jgi:hypothetical protein